MPGSAAAPGAPAEEYRWLEKKVLLSEPLIQGGKAGISLQSLDSILGKLRTRNPQGALSEVEEALRKNPNDANAYALKAKILNRMHRYDEAEEAAKQAIRLNPDQSSAYEELSWAQIKQGKYAEAADTAGKAIRSNPDNAHAYFLRALANEGLGQRDPMLSDLQRASILDGKYRNSFERARAGKKLMDPDADDSYQLLDAVAAESPRGSAVPLLGAGLILLALAIVVGFGINLWRGSRHAESEEFSRTLDAAQQVKAAEAEGMDRRRAQALTEKYEMVRVIGKGGMGQVWEARDKILDRLVAIKRLPPELSADAEARSRALQEAKTLASLHHPHIVDIIEILELPSGLYLVFELLNGKTVQEHLAQTRRMSPAQAWEILRPVCEALEFAHAKGVVHRDMKPANIMITKQGFIKVMDSGIARKLDMTSRAAPPPEMTASDGPPPPPEVADVLGELASTTPVPSSLPDAQAPAAKPEDEGRLFDLPMDRTQAVYGTPAYMPPESEQGVVSPETDVYSLGVCLYEMIVGRAPFGPDSSADKLRKAYPKPTSVVPELPPAADEILSRVLEPRLEARMRMREFAILAERLAKEPLVKPPPPKA
jgi:serine/threonine protein kinase